MNNDKISMIWMRLCEEGINELIIVDIQAVVSKIPFGATGKIGFKWPYGIMASNEFFLFSIELRFQDYQKYLRVVDIEELTLDEYIEIESASLNFQMALSIMKNLINPEPPPF